MKSKKILTAVMCFCMTAQMCGYVQPLMNAGADNDVVVEQVVQTKNYDIYLYKNLGNYVEITAVSTMATGDVVVPDKIDGLPVQIIGEHAFAGVGGVTNITLPETVTTIGKQAFYQCSSLESVNLPSAVSQIKDETFLNCASLKKITLPKYLRSIGVRAFYGCKSLEEVTIPNTVTEIGEQAFQDSGISFVDISDGVKEIEANTFYGCTNLTQIDLPHSVQTVGFNAFPKELKCLLLPNGDCELHDFAIPSHDATIIVPLNSKVFDWLKEHGYTNITVIGGAPEPVEHDLNGDGKFSIADVVFLQDWLMGRIDTSYYSFFKLNADMNDDGTVDVFDLCLMKQYYIDEILAPPVINPVLSQTVNLTESVVSEAVEGKEADEEFVAGQTKFSLELLKKSVEKDKDKNVLISPYSVMQALAMTGNGADGTTRTEMEETLGGIAFENLNKYLYSQRTNQPNDKKCKLVTANSVWSRDDDARINVHSDFLQQVVDYYGAEVFKAPFDDTTVKDINKWVDENTDHMINKVIDEISADTVMYLINAVTFDAKWQEPYPEEYIKEWDFKSYDGTMQTADMMLSEESYYLADDNAEGFLKYYDGRRYAFAALLPNENMTVDEYINTLTPESLHNIFANPTRTHVDTGLPKFSYDYSKELSKSLADMGMPTAFTGFADFSKLAKTASGALYIDFVLHKTHIDVNNEGTRAAAVTVVGMNDGAAMYPVEKKEVILDRPFLYCILDTETSLPIFIGTLNTLE